MLSLIKLMLGFVLDLPLRTCPLNKIIMTPNADGLNVVVCIHWRVLPSPRHIYRGTCSATSQLVVFLTVTLLVSQVDFISN